MIVTERRTGRADAATPDSRPRRFGLALLAAAGCVLVLLALDRLVRGLVVIPQQVEAMYGESIIYDQAARLLHGEALYQALDRVPFSVAAYTPAYYWLVAGLRMLAGPGFWPGRAASFIMGLGTAVLVGYLAIRRTGDRRAGLFAAAMFLGLGFPGDYPWFAFYKEDMLGAALSLGAIAAIDRGRPGKLVSLLAGCLAGAAILVKQTFVAASLAGVGWLWRRNRQYAVLFGATALAAPGLVCVLLAASNPAFFDNVIRANLNPTGADVLWANLDILLRYQGVPVALVLLAGAGGGARFRRWIADPLVVFWIVSLVLLPVTLVKVGSNWNYWITFAAATAPLATWSAWSALTRGFPAAWSAWRSGLTAVLLLGLLITPIRLPRPVLDVRTVVTRALQPDRQQADAFAGVLQRIRSEQREVLAEPLDMLVLADRPIVFEPYIFSILSTEGQWDPELLVRQICDGQVGLLVLDHPLEGPDWETQGYPHWPPAVLAALRNVMRLDHTQARLFLYTPGAEPVGRDGSKLACAA